MDDGIKSWQSFNPTNHGSDNFFAVDGLSPTTWPVFETGICEPVLHFILK
jgi:hypothetical protein